MCVVLGVVPWKQGQRQKQRVHREVASSSRCGQIQRNGGARFHVIGMRLFHTTIGCVRAAVTEWERTFLLSGNGSLPKTSKRPSSGTSSARLAQTGSLDTGMAYMHACVRDCAHVCTVWSADTAARSGSIYSTFTTTII